MHRTTTSMPDLGLIDLVIGINFPVYCFKGVRGWSRWISFLIHSERGSSTFSNTFYGIEKSLSVAIL